jgi:hypothetical protein
MVPDERRAISWALNLAPLPAARAASRPACASSRSSAWRITIAGTARDGAQAVRIGRELRLDVVLMDVRMPGMDSIEATRQLARSGGPGERLEQARLAFEKMLTYANHPGLYVEQISPAGSSGETSPGTDPPGARQRRT